MKKTLLFSALFTILAQTSTVSMAHANAGDVAVKATRISKLKTLLDWKFIGAISIGAWTVNELVIPPIALGLCSLESNSVGRAKVLKSPNLCKLYYNDPKINSCLTSNNGVALMFPIDETGVNAIRFAGSFDSGNRLMKVTQTFVKIKPNKDYEVLSYPMTAEIDAKGMAQSISLSPSETTSRGANEDEDQMFEHFDRVASVMGLAFNECSDGKFDLMMKKLVEEQGKAKKSARKNK